MSGLELRFLGDFGVLRDGHPLPLPPSKKTRALLAYLSLNRRSFRRERLCALLWEIPDDPRGSLRWSLSKLRRLVDDGERRRVVADRATVAVDTDGVPIDVAELRTLAGNGLADVPLEDLESAAARFRGNFLEGLEFSDFHDFHSWCVAERGQALRDRTALLAALVGRLADSPGRALPHARALVGLCPYDERHRATLIRLLHAAGQPAEAEEQYRLGLRMLEEAGVAPLGEMHAARRGPRIDRPRAAGTGLTHRTTAGPGAHPRPSDPSTGPAPTMIGPAVDGSTTAQPMMDQPRTNQSALAGSIAAEPMASESVASEPKVTGFAIERRGESVRPAVAARSPVGRDDEIALLSETLANVTGRGSARILLVRGAPGIGKSRLLEHALELARDNDAFVLRAAAFESDTVRPFAVWIDALRSLGNDDFDRIAGTGDVANRDRLFAGLSDLIARVSRERPVVLLYDDIHWSDESSAAALHYVARMNRDRPVLGLVAARDGELRDNAPVQQALRGIRRDGLLRELSLGPLREEALAELIAERAPAAHSVRLSRECAGNPLLAIELARAGNEGAGSGSLGDLVRERLVRFGATGAEVLRWAAVLRPRIDVPTLARLASLDAADVGEALELAERHAMLLATERGLRFSHDLIAKAIYTDISPLRRQVMHRRVAELLEQDTALDLARASALAHHATQSGDPGLAARAMISAGRLCLRFFANEDALSLARKGLQFAKALGEAERVSAEVELHEVLLSAGPLEDWEAAAETYAALAERALDHGALAEARLGYHMASYVRWTQGQWSAAREQTLQAERVIRGTDSQAHVVGVAETAKCLVMLERDLAQADALLMEADALARRRHFAHHAIPAGLGMLRYHENRLDEARDLLEQARTSCKSAGDRLNEFQAGEYLVMIDLQCGRLGEARSRCEQLAALGEKIREGSERPFARALLGLCAYALDDDAALLDGALEELRVVDAKYRLAYALTRAALIDCERGRKESAVARATEALGYAQILERPTEMLLAHAVLACGYGGAAGAGSAAEHAREVERLKPVAAAWTGEIAARLAAEMETRT